MGNIKSPKPEDRTASEKLFEEYLHSTGLGYFQFQKEMAGTLKKPDYSTHFMGQEILFEVKEFKAMGDEVKSDNKAHAYDPYHHIREKIGAGRKKFKDLENYCCCLVLRNEKKPLVHVQHKEFIFAAMLGNVAVQVPLHPLGEDLLTEQSRTVFSGEGGKVVHKQGKGVVIEKTISVRFLCWST